MIGNYLGQAIHLGDAGPYAIDFTCQASFLHRRVLPFPTFPALACSAGCHHAFDVKL